VHAKKQQKSAGHHQRRIEWGGNTSVLRMMSLHIGPPQGSAAEFFLRIQQKNINDVPVSVPSSEFSFLLSLD
jgi:hypothetical protein